MARPVNIASPPDRLTRAHQRASEVRAAAADANSVVALREHVTELSAAVEELIAELRRRD